MLIIFFGCCCLLFTPSQLVNKLIILAFVEINERNKFYLRPAYENIAIWIVVVARMTKTSGNDVKLRIFLL